MRAEGDACSSAMNTIFCLRVLRASPVIFQHRSVTDSLSHTPAVRTVSIRLLHADVLAFLNALTISCVLVYIYCVLQGRFYVGAQGHVPSRFTCCPHPQIQKLADRSDMISGVPKCFKSKFSRAPQSARTPLGELTALPQIH